MMFVSRHDRRHGAVEELFDSHGSALSRAALQRFVHGGPLVEDPSFVRKRDRASKDEYNARLLAMSIQLSLS